MRGKIDDLRARLLSASVAAMECSAPQALQDEILAAVVQLAQARRGEGDAAAAVERGEAALETWLRHPRGSREQTG